MALAALPILFTPYPPATDLPQHLAQVRLFEEALKDPGGPYVINWAAPGNLIYAVIFVLRAVVPPAWMARAVLIFLVLLWIAAIHFLAAARGRPEAAAIAASILVFNQSFYWGFLNFLIGVSCLCPMVRPDDEIEGASLLEVLCRARRDVLSTLWKPCALAGGGRRLACLHRLAQEDRGEGIRVKAGDPHSVRCRRASVVSPAVLGADRLRLRRRAALVAALRPLVLGRGRGLRGDPGPDGDHGLCLALCFVRHLRLAE